MAVKIKDDVMESYQHVHVNTCQVITACDGVEMTSWMMMMGMLVRALTMLCGKQSASSWGTRATQWQILCRVLDCLHHSMSVVPYLLIASSFETNALTCSHRDGLHFIINIHSLSVSCDILLPDWIRHLFWYSLNNRMICLCFLRRVAWIWMLSIR